MRFSSMILAVAVALSLVACGRSEQQSVATHDDIVLEKFVVTDNDYPSDDDIDGDGLTNGEEHVLGTDIQTSDTDKDGLDDYYEYKTSNTNPLKADTDGDGLSDGVEIDVGLDPLHTKSDGRTLDGKRKFDKTVKVDGLTLNITGDANIENVFVGTVDSINIQNIPGALSDMYEFFMPDGNTFDSATVEFKFSDETLEMAECSPDDLCVYQFKDDGTLAEVGGIVDANNHTITVNLPHFSKYILMDSRKANEKVMTDVYILLDNSGSMFSDEDHERITGEKVKKGERIGYDASFKRVDMAKKLISMTGEDIVYGLGKFTAKYTDLTGGFEPDKSKIYEKLESIKKNDETFDGTYISQSIRAALKNFTDETKNDRKFIILLTDGLTTEGGLLGLTSYNEDNAISDAIQKNVSIIIIGLGNDIDTDYLTKISSKTGGIFVHAKDADALDRVYSVLMAAINYGFSDLDGDGTNDSILLADSGFDVSRDGFGFSNYVTLVNGEEQDGQCFGLASFAQLYYRGKLPKKGSEVPSHKGTSAMSIIRTQLSGRAYDISNMSYFESGSNPLFNFEIFHGWNTATGKEGMDYYKRADNDKEYLQLSDNIQSIIDSTSLLEERTQTLKKPITYYADKKKTTKVDSFIYNLDVDRSKLSEQEKNAYDFLVAVNNLFSRQGVGEEQYVDSYSFTNATLSREIKSENFHRLIKDLTTGIPVMASSNGHTVNAIRLYRTVDNPMEYTLVCYDNNHPGKERYLTIEFVKPHGLAAIQAQNWLNTYDCNIYDTSNIYLTNNKNKAINVKFLVYK